ncbi:MAG: DUF2911 domain-containing protein [Bacteroidota bacterium]
MFRTKRFAFLALILVMCISSTVMGQQINTPAPSPSSKLMQTVGLVDVTIDYSRPGKKGREIFGNLVPYGKVWRTGANASTKITFSGDVMLEGKSVPAGTYAIYTKPGKSQWTVMLYKDLSLGGRVAGYDEAKELTRFMVTPVANSRSVESFTINVDGMNNTGATINIMWDKVIAPIKMTVDTDAAVIAQIERFAKNPTMPLANDYFSAASYYLGLKKDLDKALTWIDKAIEIRPNAFWMVRTKSLIQAEMGEYKEAIKTAEKSMKQAQQANNADYVKLNEDSIKGWKGKK